MQTYRTSHSADGKEIALTCIGDVKEPQLVRKTFEFVMSGEIPAQDIHSPFNSLAQNTKTRDLLWEIFKQHWG